MGAITVLYDERVTTLPDAELRGDALWLSAAAMHSATGWKLAPEQISKLDAASAVPLTYPYWHQRGTFLERNPSAV